MGWSEMVLTFRVSNGEKKRGVRRCLGFPERQSHWSVYIWSLRTSHHLYWILFRVVPCWFSMVPIGPYWARVPCMDIFTQSSVHTHIYTCIHTYTHTHKHTHTYKNIHIQNTHTHTCLCWSFISVLHTKLQTIQG